MKKILHMLVVLGLTGLVSGLSLAYVYEATKDEIRQNEEDRLQKALKVVFPKAQDFEPVEFSAGTYYTSKDATGTILGYASPSQGSGYQGVIKLIFGIDAKLEKLTGLVIFPCDETPGLGARIREDDWRNQFEGLTPYPSVSCIKGKKPVDPNQIQAITGATISSRSVVAAVNKGVGSLLWEIGGLNPDVALGFGALKDAETPPWAGGKKQDDQGGKH